MEKMFYMVQVSLYPIAYNSSYFYFMSRSKGLHSSWIGSTIIHIDKNVPSGSSVALCQQHKIGIFPIYSFFLCKKFSFPNQSTKYSHNPQGYPHYYVIL